MIFMRNQNGSHNPDEDMQMDDFAKAAAVLQRWMVEAAS
jgi:N-carbamoyl-L-amino-acid hydrolase